MEKRKEKKEIEKLKGTVIEDRNITQELKESYLDYAMSVIVSRALPDVRDGLKPVQRRILWSMWEMGLTHSAKFRKSSNVVGSTMAHYHPHGDASIYDSMVRMAQSFSLRYPLVFGQGNWGSVDGDTAAAMRYCITEDTLVVTNNGLIPIKNISENESEDIDMEVLSKDRSVNKAIKWFDSGKHPTIKITTNNGFSIQGSHNHPILTWIKDINNKPKFQWKLLNQIEEGDVVVIDRTSDILWPNKAIDLKKYWPSKLTRREIKILPKKMDENLAHILGALISEGTIKQNEIEFCNSDKKWIEEFERRWGKVFPDCRLHKFNRSPNSFGKKPYQTIEIHSRYVIEFLRNIGLTPVKSAQKNIPHLILQSQKSVVAEFLKAYFEGDGSISYSKKMIELSAISTSEKLISQLQVLLLRLGIVSAKRFDKYRNNHKLYIRSLKNYLLFKKQIGFISAHKNEKLNETIERLSKDCSQTDFVPFLSNYIRSQSFNFKNSQLRNDYVLVHNFDRYSNLEKKHTNIIEASTHNNKPIIKQLFEQLLLNNYFFDPIVKVENGEAQKVYSLKVNSQCHSFIGNGFVNHNTEAKLSKISDELLKDIEKDTVSWGPNYDNSKEEPKFLPAKLPNLLINGTVGIAVGMATSIAPHNLGEIIDGIDHLIENPDAKVKDLMKFIPGPDFPTGGVIYDSHSIETAYATGKGPVTMRGIAQIEEKKKGHQIIITEIPYQVNKSTLITKMADLVQNKRVDGIRDIRDESSDREGMRIVIDLKNDASPQKILNRLYQFTELQKNFSFNMLALTNEGIQPEILSIKDILLAHIEHRKIVVRKRTEFELKKAQERAHILEGLVKALHDIDRVIATIKKSKNKEDASVNLIKKFKFTPIQTNAILEMRLQSLASLERGKLESELKEKLTLIKELQLILKNPKKILNIIKKELGEIRDNFSDERRTKIVKSSLTEFREEDLIQNEDAIVVLTQDGYIKRIPPAQFKTQKRGGKGLIGFELKDEDFVEQFIVAETHDNILFFAEKGKVFQTKVYEIPVASRTAKGKSIHNYLEIPGTEKVVAMIQYGEKTGEDKYLVMATKQGVIKRTPISDFKNVRKNGLVALTLKKDDSLVWAKTSSGEDEFILSSEGGQAIRFKEKDIRSMGRTAAGVRAINLKKNDLLAGIDIIKKGEWKAPKLLTVTSNGFGKQTPLKEYKIQKRGGSGIKTSKVTEKTGKVIATRIVDENIEELLAFSKNGQVIRIPLKGVRVASRATQGVRIMNMDKGDKLIGIICL